MEVYYTLYEVVCTDTHTTVVCQCQPPGAAAPAASNTKGKGVCKKKNIDQPAASQKRLPPPIALSLVILKQCLSTCSSIPRSGGEVRSQHRRYK